MQIKNLKIFDSTIPADGAWIDVSNLVTLSVTIAGVEAATWIEVSNDQYINVNGANGGSAVSAPSAPTLTQFPATVGGLTSQGTYFVKITYITPWGETLPSTESSLAVSDGNVLQVIAPAADALGLATGWNVYIGKSSGAEVLQTGPAYVPAHTVDSTPGIHYAINGVLPLTRNFFLPNGFQHNGGAVPGSSTAGGIGIGVNVLGTSGDFSTIASPGTDATVAVFIDKTAVANVLASWAPSGIMWKWLRVRKATGTTKETIAWLTGANG